MGELKQKIAELRKTKENKVVKLEQEWKSAETITEYAEKGWTLKHYLPQHLQVDSQQLVPTVLVFEK